MVADSESPIDPELVPVLEFLEPMRDINPRSLLAVRRYIDTAMPPWRELPHDHALITERTIPGPAGAPDVRLMIFRSVDAAPAMPCLFHIHGGGYVIGSPALAVPDLLNVCAQIACTIVSVDYRLAPETRFPGAIEDCYAALKWTHDHAADLGIDPARIGIGGESAGGGLAAALTLLARDRGEWPIAFQHLIYPMLDDRTCLSLPHRHGGVLGWSEDNNRFGWRSLLGAEPGAANVSPYAAPARATDLNNLPPAFILVGALDLFLKEDVDYAMRLSQAGVPVELHVYPRAIHGFQISAEAHVTRCANRDSITALRRFMMPGEA